MIDISTNEGRGGMVLGIVRIVLGFMFIWAFFDKLLGLGMRTTPEAAVINGGSPTAFYLSQMVSGPFEEMWNALAGNAFIDFLLMFGLLAVGACLVLGIASKLSTIGIVIMMALMFTLCIPPLDYHIVYILTALAVYFLNGFSYIGLEDRWRELGIVKKLPILE